MRLRQRLAYWLFARLDPELAALKPAPLARP
jgi:hypothetical protein